MDHRHQVIVTLALLTGMTSVVVTAPSQLQAQSCGTPIAWSYDGGGCCVENLLAIVNCDGSVPTLQSGVNCYSGPLSPTNRPGCPSTCSGDYNCGEIAPCGSASCAPTDELCDGIDNNHDGGTDEGGVCGGGGPCENYRTDPVHVGTGAFVTEPAVDVQFAGSDTVPLQFVRRYSSMERWPQQANIGAGAGLRPTRMAVGWLHNFDERLFKGDGRGGDVPAVTWASAFTVIHRGADGRGRSFACTSPASPAAFSCSSRDGSLDVLEYRTSTSDWLIRSASGVRTRFATSGTLIDQFDGAGEGWTVHYHASGAFDGYIDYVEDHLGRRLGFEWISPTLPSDQIILDRITDGSGATLAEYFYIRRGRYLLGVRTAAVRESYSYASMLIDTRSIELPYLTEIEREGSTVVSVVYDYDEASRTIGRGRVTAITASDGTYAFRAPGAANNLCDTMGHVESRTAMIIDRSTPSVPLSCATDNACATGTACSDGVCRPFTCQQFSSFAGSVNYDAVESIGGNCPCGGVSSYDWTAPSSTSPTRPRRTVSRDGLVTTMNYDSNSRIVARCAGDDPADSGWDATTCPTSGELTTWEYDTSWPTQVRFERRRSRLSTAMLAETEYVYDSGSSGTGRLRYVHRRGYSRNTADAVVGPLTETTEYRYTLINGVTRLTEVLGPAGERTTYEYWSAGSGTNSGMLRYERRYHSATGALVTTYSSYTSTGRPQTVVDPSGRQRTYNYDFEGLRLLSTTVAGRTTTFTYDSAGRLSSTTHPTNRREVYTYDARSRVERVDTFDSAGAGAAERRTHAYDDAGRMTQTALHRVTSGGVVSSTAYHYDATYESHGFLQSTQTGPQQPVTYTYDPVAMGYLESALRGDGDVEEYDRDLFGREAARRRFFGSGAFGEHNVAYRNEQGSNIETGSRLPTRVEEPNGQVRTYVYDDFGHLVRSASTEWGIERWSWHEGRLHAVLHADGRLTEYAYDLAGRVRWIDHNALNPGSLGQDYEFFYDNSVTCPSGTAYACANRVGRLSRVRIEYAPGLYWNMNYDYAPNGQVGFEMYPDGRSVRYEYDSSGRMVRMRYPGTASDALRFDYDAVSGNGVAPEDVMQIIGERGGATYVQWAREIERDAAGRLTSVLQHDSYSTGPRSWAQYRPDGRLSCWIPRRRTNSSGGTAPVIDRCYNYSPDGSAVGHDSLVTADGERTWFYDGANRLRCASSSYSSTSCPTGSDLIERLEYDAGDNRTLVQRSAGTTSYVLSGNTFYDEYPPGGRTIWYAYEQGAGGPRIYDSEATPGAPDNYRTYIYDGQGRLQVLQLSRPTPTPSTTREPHTLTVLYDHRSRPLAVLDHNGATSVEARTFYYYDLQNRLIAHEQIPNAATPTTRTFSTFAWVDPLLVGSLRTDYSGGTGSEAPLYHVLQPEGLPAATYGFSRTSQATVELWRAQWGPFGTRLSTTGVSQGAPPFLFAWQLVLPNSDASWWNGTTLYQSREPLALNRWRVYDPRVGQYLQPEPLVLNGSVGAVHAYSYGALQPQNMVDPDGRWFWLIPAACVATGTCEVIIVGGLAVIATGVAICSAQIGGYRDPPTTIDIPRPRINPCRFAGGLPARDIGRAGCRYTCAPGEYTDLDCPGSCEDGYDAGYGFPSGCEPYHHE